MSIGRFALPGALLLCAVAEGACLAQTTTFALKNGMNVVVRERHGAPLVAIELWVRAGAREERPDEFGAAHFLEHTLFKGTTSRGVGEADAAIENLGATLSASTGPDFARYYTGVPEAHASEALAILADVVRNATLPAREIERERQVICDELAQRESDPAALLIDRLYAAAFRFHPYGRPPGGTQTSIRMRTRNSLEAFYHRNYTPPRCTLVLAGDLAADAARKYAESAFADWRAEPGTSTARSDAASEGVRIEASAAAPTTAPANSSAPSTEAQRDSAEAPSGALRFVETADVARPIVGIAFRAPPAADRSGACTAQVAAAMLGMSDIGGRLATARLSGSGARATFAPRRDLSLFILSAAAALSPTPGDGRNDAVATAAVGQEAALLAVLDGLTTTPPSPSELLAAKSAMLATMTFDLETNTGLAAAIGSACLIGGQQPEEWRESIKAVTIKDVRQFIARTLDSTRRIAMIILPRPAAGAREPQ